MPSALDDLLAAELAELRPRPPPRLSPHGRPSRAPPPPGRPPPPRLLLQRLPRAGRPPCPPPRPPARRSRSGFGAGASRLVSGDLPEHRALEHALAAFLGRPAALLFPTGYQANLGVLTTLAGREDLIVSDAANHASLIDGCRLSRAAVARLPPPRRRRRPRRPGRRRPTTAAASW